MLKLRNLKYQSSHTVAQHFDAERAALGHAVPHLAYHPEGARVARVVVAKCAIVGAAYAWEVPLVEGTIVAPSGSVSVLLSCHMAIYPCRLILLCSFVCL